MNFNSIKVRLELTAGAGLVGSLLFQFHKGAIRTLVLQMLISRRYNFNSIKVRLEQSAGLRCKTICRYFNSIKVRLEHFRRRVEIALDLFQFHKGAIRTAWVKILTHRFPRFQFHKGAIRTSGKWFEGDLVRLFQFHKGAIRTRGRNT